MEGLFYSSSKKETKCQAHVSEPLFACFLGDLASRLKRFSAGKTTLLSRGVGGLRTGGDRCLDVSGLCQ